MEPDPTDEVDDEDVVEEMDELEAPRIIDREFCLECVFSRGVLGTVGGKSEL